MTIDVGISYMSKIKYLDDICVLYHLDRLFIKFDEFDNLLERKRQ